MSAPGEATGGSRGEVPAASPGPPRRARGVVGKAQSPSQRRNRRAEAIDVLSGLAIPKAKPRHDTARSARPSILAATRKLVARDGYEQLQVQDITREAKISHQAFYGHFANKRHAVAVATSDELGAVAEMVMGSARRSERWAQRLLDDIDDALAEIYPPVEGPSQRLRRRLIRALRSEGGYEALRIVELVRVSKIGHGEFYRRYGGKKGCLQRIYAEASEEIAEEIAGGEGQGSLLALAAALAADSGRCELLVIGSSYLPSGPSRGPGAVGSGRLSDLIDSLVAPTELPIVAHPSEALLGALTEVIRSTVIAGLADELPDRIAVLGEAGLWPGGSADGWTMPLAA